MTEVDLLGHIELLISSFLLIGIGGTWMDRNLAKWLTVESGLGVLCDGTLS